MRKFNIKLIYFSTSYVYPGKNGGYKENSALLPINNYAWSKLGGESSVKLLKNSLILDCAWQISLLFTKKRLKAKSSFIYNKSVSKIIPFIIDQKGTINVGGEKRDIYQFAKNFQIKELNP